jgi:hypothetical protein
MFNAPATLCEPVELTLEGLDGNAFSLMGAWRLAAKRQGRTPDEITAVLNECMSSDYDNLLCVLVNHTK